MAILETLREKGPCPWQMERVTFTETSYFTATFQKPELSQFVSDNTFAALEPHPTAEPAITNRELARRASEIVPKWDQVGQKKIGGEKISEVISLVHQYMYCSPKRDLLTPQINSSECQCQPSPLKTLPILAPLLQP